MNQETLLDYTPTQAEEIARLQKKADEQNARYEALENDPVFLQAEVNFKAISKKINEMAKVRDELQKITHQLTKVALITLEEPIEEGLYIFTKAERGYSRDGKIRMSRSLLLKAMGEWFNLSDHGSNTLPGWNSKATPFNDFLDIDGDTIEVTLTKYEDTSRYPHELLKDSDEDADVAEIEDEGDEE